MLTRYDFKVDVPLFTQFKITSKFQNPAMRFVCTEQYGEIKFFVRMLQTRFRIKFTVSKTFRHTLIRKIISFTNSHLDIKTPHPLLVSWSGKFRAIILPTLWATPEPVNGTLYILPFYITIKFHENTSVYLSVCIYSRIKQ